MAVGGGAMENGQPRVKDRGSDTSFRANVTPMAMAVTEEVPT